MAGGQWSVGGTEGVLVVLLVVLEFLVWYWSTSMLGGMVPRGSVAYLAPGGGPVTVTT